MADHGSLSTDDRRISPESPDPEPPQPNPRISVGHYNENWVESWQNEMFVYHRLMTNRLVTTFYGHYPDNNAEMCLFRFVLQLFNRIKTGVLKRIALARRLEDTIDSEKREDPEGAALLRWLNIYLCGRIQSFKNKYELLSKFTQAKADENEEVTAFLHDLKAHSEAFKNAAYAEMIDDACESVARMSPYIDEDEDAIERVSIRDMSIPEGDEDAAGDEDPPGDEDGDAAGNEDEVVVKEDEADADEHEAVGEKDGDDDKMDAGDDDKKVTGEGDKDDDDKMVIDKDDSGEEEHEAVGEKNDDDDKRVTDKDDSGEEDKKVTKDDISDENKMVTDKGDTSDDVDKIMTDKDDTSDDVERIMTDKDDTSDDSKMVTEKDDAGDKDQAMGDEKQGKASMDDKIVTKQDDSDSESGWC